MPRTTSTDPVDEEVAAPTGEEATVEPPTSEQPDAVLILKKIDSDGSINTQAVPLGNVQATEVQTLIELGLQSWRKSIGL